MPLGPNSNPGLGSQASIPRGLAIKPSQWGPLTHTAGLCLPPRRKMCYWELWETLRAGETCTLTSGHAHLWLPFCQKKPETEDQPHTLTQRCPRKLATAGGPPGIVWDRLAVSHGHNMHLAKKCSEHGARGRPASVPNAIKFSQAFSPN